MILQTMAQMNLQITPQFAADLRRFMRARSIENKSEAVRIAVAEAASRAEGRRSWYELAGILKPAIEAGVRLPTDDEIWADAPLPSPTPDADRNR